jgi:two-component system cell cycle response regulator DivK
MRMSMGVEASCGLLQHYYPFFIASPRNVGGTDGSWGKLWGKARHFLNYVRLGMSKTVLIVEDNELNMKLFHDLLEAQGYDTLQTKDGREALQLAREHHPDLVLMDIQLPEVSGLEVTKWIKEDDKLRDIPVIAVTAFAMKGDEEKIRQGGCEAYIAKPISVSEFLETVQKFIDA